MGLTTKKTLKQEMGQLSATISDTEARMERCVEDLDIKGWMALRDKMHVYLSRQQVISWQLGGGNRVVFAHEYHVTATA